MDRGKGLWWDTNTQESPTRGKARCWPPGGVTTSSSCSRAWATRTPPAPSASPREPVRCGATAGRAARAATRPRTQSGRRQPCRSRSRRAPGTWAWTSAYSSPTGRCAARACRPSPPGSGAAGRPFAARWRATAIGAPGATPPPLQGRRDGGRQAQAAQAAQARGTKARGGRPGQARRPLEPRADFPLARAEYPDNEGMDASTETIYQAIYIQAKGQLKRDISQQLRSGRTARRPRTAAGAQTALPRADGDDLRAAAGGGGPRRDGPLGRRPHNG